MKLVKSAKFAYTGNEEVIRLLETFRSMVNDAIRVGLESKAKSKFVLGKLCYHESEAAVWPARDVCWGSMRGGFQHYQEALEVAEEALR